MPTTGGRRCSPAILLLVLGLAGACGSRADRTPTLTIFAAASLGEVLGEVGTVYERSRDVDLIFNFAGSGELARQLLAAPRADVFVSASEEWMRAAEEGGRIVGGTRVGLLSNTLALIAHPRSGIATLAPEDLCTLEFRLLSLGDPEAVPAGGYARGWLESIACPDGGSAWERVRDRIAPAPDVRAALMQVRGNVDVLGIVYRTDAVARPDDVRTVYEVGVHDGPTIEYPAAVVAGRGDRARAREFVAYLRGPEARAIFEQYGFVVLADD